MSVTDYPKNKYTKCKKCYNQYQRDRRVKSKIQQQKHEEEIHDWKKLEELERRAQAVNTLSKSSYMADTVVSVLDTTEMNMKLNGLMTDIKNLTLIVSQRDKQIMHLSTLVMSMAKELQKLSNKTDALTVSHTIVDTTVPSAYPLPYTNETPESQKTPSLNNMYQ